MKSLDQGIFLFDNQYHPDIISRVYHRVRETTWDHCMNIQKAMCQHHVIGGLLADFKVDEVLNKRQGFPSGAYTLFIKEKLLEGNQKYILEHFVRKHELFSLRDMLKNPLFKKQYIFHIADYTFMDLKCQLTQNGTYLVIPIGTPDGISAKKMKQMMDDYGNPYTPSRWMLELRPKVSYGYCRSTTLQIFENAQPRIYFKKFTETMNYYKADAVNDWKVCISESRDELNLLRVTPAVMKYDEVTGEKYLEVSQAFTDYIRNASFAVQLFAYNEAFKAGFTISPNYIGPSQFLKTTFDEYMATVEAQKLKVVAMDSEGGWVSLPGADKKFDMQDDLVSVGFSKSECWIALPTDNGVAPIYPGNFRVWEYDPDTDTLGRMVASEMSAAFPNIYFYKMKTDCRMIYIEWYRDDITVGANYDDFTKDYRKFIGKDFAKKLVNDELPESLINFMPVHSVFSPNDFVKNILMYSSHEYRVAKIAEILKDSGLHYDEIIDAIDNENIAYTTVTYDVAKQPAIFQRFSEATTDYSYVRVSATEDNIRPYSLFVDGMYVSDTQTYWKGFIQYITIPKKLIKADSVIIIDLFDRVPQVADHTYVNQDFMRSIVRPRDSESIRPPSKFEVNSHLSVLEKLSANDVVVTDTDGKRIDASRIIYGLYANELLIQVPETMIDWDSLGITIDDPRIADRVAIQHPDGRFKAVVFRLIIPIESEFAKMTTTHGESIRTVDGQGLLVSAGSVFVTTEGYEEIDPTKINKFSKKVRAKDLAIKILGIGTVDTEVLIFNNSVFRKSTSMDLSKSNTVVIPSFCGADDPTRLVAFIDGSLAGPTEIDGQIPEMINSDFTVTFNGTYGNKSIGEVVYLPFPTDRFDVVSDANGYINLANSGVMVIGIHDMIFEDGARIPNDRLIRITNQIVKAPKPNAMYTIIRTHRDSNLFEFHDVTAQSIIDKLFIEDPAYKEHVLNRYQNAAMYSNLSDDEISILSILD